MGLFTKSIRARVVAIRSPRTNKQSRKGIYLVSYCRNLLGRQESGSGVNTTGDRCPAGESI